jgi:ABC-type transport system involved in cytochrome c biogenesis permease subunit
MKTLFSLLILLAGLEVFAQSGTQICSNKKLESLPSYYEAQLLPTISLSRKLFERVDKEISNTELICRLNLGDEKLLKNISINGKRVDKYLEEIDEIKKNLEMKHSDELAQIYIDLKNIQNSLKGNIWKVQATPKNLENWLKISAIKNPSTHLKFLVKDSRFYFSYDHVKVEIEYLSEKYPIKTIVFISSILIFVFSIFFNFPLVGGVSLALLTFTPVLFRVLISSRAPVTNMYETVLFGAFSISIFSLVLHFRKVNLLRVASLFTALSYGLLIFGHTLFNSNVKLLRPVLRDNVWLSTHVTLIVFAYAVFSASWIFSFFNLLAKKYNEVQKEVTLNLIKIGLIFLFAGTVLGAVWADKAWGRFWGWDPKETWALISIAIYTAIIHLNYRKPLSCEKTYILVFASYSSIIMAWFGVNYLIATGMHTYGFQDGKGVTFVLLFLLSQLLCGIYFLCRGKV